MLTAVVHLSKVFFRILIAATYCLFEIVTCIPCFSFDSLSILLLGAVLVLAQLLKPLISFRMVCY